MFKNYLKLLLFYGTANGIHLSAAAYEMAAATAI
jgi:hypothetical protein